MAENLVIVESPTKAKTLKKFLGKDFSIKSSNGHIRDLEKKGLGIDIEDNFSPNYIIIQEKKKLLANLKKEIKSSKYVWLASDEDREGEAIAWHLSQALKIDEKKTKRVAFHEITKNAILEAFKKPRKIDINLVNAQQARRVLDRIIGFEISPILWRKIKPALSAGRVQSVAVKLIVEREKEIELFKPKLSFRINAEFSTSKYDLKANLNEKFTDKEIVLKFFDECKGATFKIKDISTQPTFRKPAPPFTTSSLQQAASLQLGYSVSKTMLLAQQLYESGFITYMRTDSVNISNVALKSIATEITSKYGKKYLAIRKYTSKNKSAQEAHEAIRPTNISTEDIKSDKSKQLLYNLIRKKTLASQMTYAKLEKKTITIAISTLDKTFIATGETLLFDGFLKIYSTKSDKSTILPPSVNINDSLSLVSMIAKQNYSTPPVRYNEATLVKKLEELGIGRPSTYAPTIVTIQNRNYVERKNILGSKKKLQLIEYNGNRITEKTKETNYGSEKRKLTPTDIGNVVTDFLSIHFQKIMNYNFTAQTEENLDKIATGKEKWKNMLASFYTPFHQNIKSVDKIKGKFRNERLLGNDPFTNLPIYAKIGKYGPMIQMGKTGETEKLNFASLLPKQTIQSITLKEALELFKFPKEIGTYKNNPISIGRSKFGPYIKYNKKFISIPKTANILEITKEDAISIIKKNVNNKVILKKFADKSDIVVRNGPYGPYIAYKNKNYKIPKSIKKKPEDLSIEECIKLVSKVK